MKAELQKYLQSVFGIREPYATNEINCDYSVGGQVHIRFELGEELPNGTKERVEQATQRAVTIFKETFEELENEIWVLIYAYEEESFDAKTPGFLYQQFPSLALSGFYNQLDTIDKGGVDVDEAGNETKSEIATRIVIGKVKVKHIHFENILEAIANAEMGFEPRIDEKIYFIDPQTDRIFRMYDDRGCFVESSAADNIRGLYVRRNSWIVDYHRPEIDIYFL